MAIDFVKRWKTHLCLFKSSTNEITHNRNVTIWSMWTQSLHSNDLRGKKKNLYVYEIVEFIACTADSQQVAMDMLCLHLWEPSCRSAKLQIYLQVCNPLIPYFSLIPLLKKQVYSKQKAQLAPVPCGKGWTLSWYTHCCRRLLASWLVSRDISTKPGNSENWAYPEVTLSLHEHL